jgi:hypothetical protein
LADALTLADGATETADDAWVTEAKGAVATALVVGAVPAWDADAVAMRLFPSGSDECESAVTVTVEQPASTNAPSAASVPRAPMGVSGRANDPESIARASTPA